MGDALRPRADLGKGSAFVFISVAQERQAEDTQGATDNRAGAEPDSYNDRAHTAGGRRMKIAHRRLALTGSSGRLRAGYGVRWEERLRKAVGRVT